MAGASATTAAAFHSESSKPDFSQSGLFQARVVHFPAVNIGSKNWRRRRLPRFVGHDCFVTAVGVIDFELRHKTVGRRKEMHSDPSQAAAIPAVTQQSADDVVAVDQ